MHFQLESQISDIEPIAAGPGILDLARLRKQFGPGRWGSLGSILETSNKRKSCGSLEQPSLSLKLLQGARFA
jgi:hypothetical protein